MIYGVGTDLISRRRIFNSWERFGQRLVDRILTGEELERFNVSARPDNVLAKCFAAKEAVAKALGTGIGQGVSWQHIELRRAPSGQPFVTLTGTALAILEAKGAKQVLISLSDEQDYVLAFAVLAS